MALDLPPAPRFLERWRGACAYYVPLEGNHGDHLIELGTREVLRRLAITGAARPQDADLILVNGGGGFARGMYDHGYSRIADLAAGFPGTPLVVLPSSFCPEGAEREWVDRLAGHRAPVWLCLRERGSHDRLQALGLPPHVHLFLDHDMAFYLAGSPVLQEWQRSSAEHHLLVVERFDLEQSTAGNRYLAWGVASGRFLGKRFIRFLYRRAIAGRLGRTAFARTAIAFAGDARQRAQENVRNILYGDIGIVQHASFDEFVDRVVRASAIVTTRLHVGILGALLGKAVYLQPTSGRYRKIESVYGHSLVHYPSVKLLEALGEAQTAKCLRQARKRHRLLF